MRWALAAAFLLLAAACAPAAVVDSSTSSPGTTTAASTTSAAVATSTTTTSTTLPPGPAKVPVEEILPLGEQALSVLEAQDIGWDETHGPETSYVSAVFDIDGTPLVLWVVVGDDLEDLLGFLGSSYRPYAQYQPVVISTEAGDVETYVLPPTPDVDYEVRLARLVGVCDKYQVALQASDAPDLVRLLEAALLGIACP